MSDYTIHKMNDEMLQDLQRLFEIIYPNDSCTVRKLLYKNDHPDHIVTLVARDKNELIGQVNIFHKDLLGGIINIGCHVVDRFRSQGVGERLVRESIKCAMAEGHQKFHIITESSNLPARRLAEKLSFSKSEDTLFDDHVVYYKLFG